MNWIWERVPSVPLEIRNGIVSAVVVYGAHYGSTKIYSEFCVPNGLWGFVSGFFTTGSPICSVALQIIDHTGSAYTTAISVGLTTFLLNLIGGRRNPRAT